MEMTIKTRESSELYRKIDALWLTEPDRLEVEGALTAAARMWDAFDSGSALVTRVGGWLALSPKLKHQ